MGATCSLQSCSFASCASVAPRSTHLDYFPNMTCNEPSVCVFYSAIDDSFQTSLHVLVVGKLILKSTTWNRLFFLPSFLVSETHKFSHQSSRMQDCQIIWTNPSPRPWTAIISQSTRRQLLAIWSRTSILGKQLTHDSCHLSLWTLLLLGKTENNWEPTMGAPFGLSVPVLSSIPSFRMCRTNSIRQL